MSTADDLERTPLHDLHVELGARMVPFAGYSMPVQYPAGIIDEHRHTRAAAGLFDVSHMGQVHLHGDGADAALERLVCADVVGLQPGRQRYALFTAADGGILDDLMIARAADHLALVVNAACKAADIAHLEAGVGADCEVRVRPDLALLALQGPAAAGVLQRIAPDCAAMRFMDARPLTVDGIDCFASRSGYTGEDGFEIAVPADAAEALARRLLAEPEVAPVGLGARDSLRLEAGLPLYGHDIDTSTSPVEAGLAWAINKARRPDGARAGGYPGAEVVAVQMRDGVSRRRVGLRPQGRAPVREGAELVDAQGHTAGRVTSGGFGPSVGGPVAMGYVATEALDAALSALVRGKPLPVERHALPFVEQRYAR